MNISIYGTLIYIDDDFFFCSINLFETVMGELFEHQ